MWGLMFTQERDEDRKRSFASFEEISNSLNVRPYYVKRTNGFMISPVYDIDLEVLKEGCLRLQKAVEQSLKSKELDIDSRH
mmetsp:Transcript_8177/g.9260  ORF Transcript_8177/g.9260 Transcript_8177/m.9260 type:complete len:81 (-) Transcript_8177:210-452(-)